MSPEPKATGLLAEYLAATTEERDAWQALSDCKKSMSDCTEAFGRWKRASEASRKVALRWQAAIGSRRRLPPE